MRPTRPSSDFLRENACMPKLSIATQQQLLVYFLHLHNGLFEVFNSGFHLGSNQLIFTFKIT